MKASAYAEGPSAWVFSWSLGAQPTAFSMTIPLEMGFLLLYFPRAIAGTHRGITLNQASCTCLITLTAIFGAAKPEL